MIELNEIDKERAEMVDRIEETNRAVEDLKEEIENKERQTVKFFQENPLKTEIGKM